MQKLKIFTLYLLMAFIAPAMFTSCSSSSSDDPEPAKYTVTFKANYEGSDEGENLSITATENVDIDLTEISLEFSRPGYRLTGWARTATADQVEYARDAKFKASSDLILYAVWTKVESFVVTYDSNFIAEGASASETKTQTVKVLEGSQSFTLDKNPFTREGYVFEGWSVENSVDASADIYDEATIDYFYNDITFYAVWITKENSITVTYNINDGSESPAEKLFYVRKGSSFTITSEIFTRENYVLSGWALEKDATKAIYSAYDEEIFEENTTLYAVWIYTGPLTLTFDANGGADENGITSLTR